MATTKWVSAKLTLCKTEVAVRIGALPQADLRFWAENPRVYSILNADEPEPPQDVIEKRLADMDHVKQLVHSIRANGGLTDPLLVRDDANVVLEGNCRLAAYRILARNDPIAWGMVKCHVLPTGIDTDKVFALLGNYHIIARKDWAPYEQAGYFYRRHTQHNVATSAMAKELGLSPQRVAQLIHVYKFMIEQQDNDVSRWSHYERLLTMRVFNKAREEHPDFDKVIVRKIKSGEIAKAVDIRDKVRAITTAGGNTLKTFLTRRNSLDDCHEKALSRGAGNVWYKRLNRLRKQVVDPDTTADFQEMPPQQRKRCIYELKKIGSEIAKLLEKLSNH